MSEGAVSFVDDGPDAGDKFLSEGADSVDQDRIIIPCNEEKSIQ